MWLDIRLECAQLLLPRSILTINMNNYSDWAIRLLLLGKTKFVNEPSQLLESLWLVMKFWVYLDS